MRGLTFNRLTSGPDFLETWLCVFDPKRKLIMKFQHFTIWLTFWLIVGTLIFLNWTPQKEIDEAFNRQDAGKLLIDVVGFTPSKPTLVFSWYNCCKPSLFFFGRGPGSKCAVYQLTGADFARVSTTIYPTSERRMTEGKCTGPDHDFVGYGKYKMKGCSELNSKLPSFEKVQWTAQGETCSADTGNILKISKANRFVMIERYWGD